MLVSHRFNSFWCEHHVRDALVLLASMLLLLFMAAGAWGQTQEEEPTPIQLGLGRAHVVNTPFPVLRVAVSSPQIADVQVLSPQQLMVIGKAAGSTDLIYWDEKNQAHNRQINVVVDQAELTAKLNEFFPGSDLSVTQVRDALVVRGKLRNGTEVIQLQQLMETAGAKYVDMTNLEGVQQVMVKVRVAEASRQAMRSLNINSVYAGDDFFGGTTLGGNANAINIGVPAGAPAASGLPFVFNNATSVGSAVTLFAGFPGADLQTFIEAMENNQYLRILAEPTLVTLSGQEASFLAGGEFPVPVVQNSGGGSGASVTIVFKEFGVRLKFKPTVMGEETIQLHVAPEVSDLSDFGAVEVQGFRIPAIITRRAEATLQMKSGQTFAMAGLISRKTSSRVGQVPGLGDLPVLGSLFRSIRYEQGETELLLLVTVELVEPLNDANGRPLPGDLHVRPNDWELYSQGRLEGHDADTPRTPKAPWIKEMGLDRLRGPGAWADYGQPAFGK